MNLKTDFGEFRAASRMYIAAKRCFETGGTAFSLDRCNGRRPVCHRFKLAFARIPYHSLFLRLPRSRNIALEHRIPPIERDAHTLIIASVYVINGMLSCIQP